MTEFSEAEDKEEIIGNTLLFEGQNIEYVYTSGFEIFKFKTDDEFIDYISFICNNMIPYTFAVGEKYTYFLSSHYTFIKNDRIEQGTLFHATNNSLNPNDYHAEKVVKMLLKS